MGGGGKLGLIGAVFALIGLAILVVQLKDFRRAGDDFADRRAAMEERMQAMERRIHGEPAPAPATSPAQAVQAPVQQTGQQAGQDQPQDQPQEPLQAGQAAPAAPVQVQRRLTPEEELQAEFGRFREKADRVAAGQRAIGELLDEITRP